MNAPRKVTIDPYENVFVTRQINVKVECLEALDFVSVGACVHANGGYLTVAISNVSMGRADWETFKRAVDDAFLKYREEWPEQGIQTGTGSFPMPRGGS